MTGPLAGVRVLELAAIGPAPFASMLLAELGADVVRVDRPGGTELTAGDELVDLTNRGKRSILLDLKTAEGVDMVLQLAAKSDILIEGSRPGVAERLGIGPEACFAVNPRLVYGRMTGWGQTGPLADRAGHDIDYLALSGALDAIGKQDGAPTVPLNLVGDFGGGANYLVMGVLAALIEARASGTGQVVDAAIVDGAIHLMTVIHLLSAAGRWTYQRGVNMLDGGVPYYDVYRTSDDRYMAVGAIEPRFYRLLLAGLELDLDPAEQDDPATWPATRAALERAFASRKRAEWTAIFEGTDACVSPVLNTLEAAADPHIRARGSLVERDGVLQSAPAPRFSRTVTGFTTSPALPGTDAAAILADWGIEA